MAQVTESLVREYLKYTERDERPPITIREIGQLCYAWLRFHDLPAAMPSEPQPGTPDASR